MIVLKILGIVAGILIGSAWLSGVISAGVASGLKNYFEKYSKEKK